MGEPSMPPFRADHVGSLIRPPELLRARDDHKAGRIDAAALRRVEDEAVRRAARMQEELGLHSVTDGEFRRESWHWDFYQRIGGIESVPRPAPVQFSSQHGAMQFTTSALHAKRRLTLDEPIFGEDFSFLRSVTRATPKLTIPAPSVLHRRGGSDLVDPAVYPDIEQFWQDLAAVYAAEIRRLRELGCTYLQLDDTSFSAMCDPTQRAAMAELGSDGEHIHETYIRLVNDAVRDKPADMTISVHTCRGNFRGAWFASGSYDFIAEPLFSTLAVDAFFLEYDDERAGGFEPLRFVPKGKKVVLGLVTTKKGRIETKDELKRRIDAAAKFLPLEQLCLSPQCGFSSVVESNAVTVEEQAAKLRLVVETAREVWEH